VDSDVSINVVGELSKKRIQHNKTNEYVILGGTWPVSSQNCFKKSCPYREPYNVFSQGWCSQFVGQMRAHVESKPKKVWGVVSLWKAVTLFWDGRKKPSLSRKESSIQRVEMIASGVLGTLPGKALRGEVGSGKISPTKVGWDVTLGIGSVALWGGRGPRVWARKRRNPGPIRNLSKGESKGIP